MSSSCRLIGALEAAGKIRPGSRSLLARVGIAVVVRAEAPKPDISSAEALRATLLQARTITHADPQATPGGRHIAALLKQWDITDTPQRRITPKSAISGGAELIANGDVDIGLYLLSEVLTVKGVAVAGMLPPALQNYIVYAGAVLADSASPDAALDFIKFLADPSNQAQWQTTGFESIAKTN
jgi:molybdate transport system substrate-binding protein